MRDPENIRAIEALGVDWMGFIFWPKSSRYVGERPAYLPTRVKRVGVFVDDDIQNIKQKVEDFGLDIIQLHGQESPDYVRQLTSVCGDSIAIIKAFNIATAEAYSPPIMERPHSFSVAALNLMTQKTSGCSIIHSASASTSTLALS